MQVVEEKSVGPVEVKSEVVMHLQPAQIMASLMQSPNAITISEEVQAALAKFEHKPITKSELGPLVEMDQEEMKMLDLFWEPTFNKGWIYLSDDMIKTQLTNEKSKNAVGHFYERVLDTEEKDYIEDKNFKRIAYDDSLIDLYYKSCPPPEGSNSKRKNVANKRYYAVTGETYKDLLSKANTPAGKASRLLFRKVEAAARLMYDYINAMHAIAARKTIMEFEAQTAGQNQQRALMNQISQSMSHKGPTGWLYVATSQFDLATNHFKIGATENLEGRLRQYSTTFSTPATEVYYVEYWHVHEPAILEKTSKILLKSYHLHNPGRKRQDETYIVNYDIIHETLSRLCTGYSSAIDYVNQKLATYEADISRPSIVTRKLPPSTMLRIEMKISTVDQSLVIPLNLEDMSESEKADACRSLINSYVRARKGHPAYDIAADEKDAILPKINIAWPDVERLIKDSVPHGNKGKVKSSAWRRVVAATLTSLKNIDYRGKK